jgi:PAS domain S-box-containing protein
MNLLSILSAMAFTVYMFIGIYGFNLNRSSILNKLFLALCSCFAAWAFAFIFIYPNYFGDTIWHWIIDKVGAFGWCTYYGVIFHISHIITGKENKIRGRLRKFFIYFPGAALLLSDMIAFAPGVKQTKWALNTFAIGSLLVSTTFVAYSLLIIYKWGRTTKGGKEKKQSKIIVITGVITYSISLVFQSVFPMFGIPTIFAAQIYSLIMTFGVYFAITRYRFMAITSSYAAEYILPKIKDMIILLDTNNAITYINQQVKNTLGFSLEELQQKDYTNILNNTIEISSRKQEGICIDRCGNEIEVEVSFQEVFDKEGDFIGTLIILSDIREAKRLQQETADRKQAESSIHNLLDNNLLIQNSRDAVLIHRKGMLLFANDSASRLLGFESPEELNMKSIFDITSDDVRANLEEKLNMLYEDKMSMLIFDSKVMNSSGEVIHVENTSTYFVYDGEPTILSILHDITPQKQVEQLKKDAAENEKLLKETMEMNKLITDFFSNVSHELKTPLNVIFTAIQTLKFYNDEGENNKIKREKYFYMMKQNCYRLTRLINNLLDMTRIDSGFIKPHFKNYNIVGVIEEVTMSVVDYVQGMGISLTFDTEIEEKIMACDGDKIERILLNLISNSVKFTNANGKIMILIEEEEDKIIITVKDTGVGIPEEKLELIFDRFGQVDKTFTRNREGSGIGLSLVKSFVEMHGGSINARSKLNEGSEFIITLPITHVEDNVEEDTHYEVNIERINIEFSDIYGETNYYKSSQIN